jgi:hypothetical protein
MRRHVGRDDFALSVPRLIEQQPNKALLVNSRGVHGFSVHKVYLRPGC